MRSVCPWLLLALASSLAAGCSDKKSPVGPGEGGSSGEGGSGGGSTIPNSALVINEAMANNEGAWIDELGETDDWVELHNRSGGTLNLQDFWLEDKSGERTRLPARTLAPGAAIVLFADSDPEQGELHLPFKLGADGEQLVLSDGRGRLLDRVELPALGENESFARFPNAEGNASRCRYPTPGKSNGESCKPPLPPSLTNDVTFQSYALPDDFGTLTIPLALTELALRPALGKSAFVELKNLSTSAIELDDYRLFLSPHKPHQPWPQSGEGEEILLPANELLAPGERIEIPVATSELSTLEADPAFEGVLGLFEVNGALVERVDFMRWPRGSALARAPETQNAFRFCTNTTPGAENECVALASRDVGDRVRHLRTPGDYAALAAGASEVGIESVKFVVDLQAPGLVHLLGSARWPLHYTFIRELVYLEPALDRCDAAEALLFDQGWRDFSDTEYFQVEGRHFLLGTLSHHGGPDLRAVEYASGDELSPAQMLQAFRAVLPHTQDPDRWVLRPQDQKQVQKARSIEGTLPLVGPNAAFSGVSYQPLTEGVTFGTLRFVASVDLPSTVLGPRVIVVTDDVPNDIPLVGGLVTEAFQTPLAHVNVLSQNRGTPNASLKGARQELEPYFDQLVRLEVKAGGLEVKAASPDEASAFWQNGGPPPSPVTPVLDTSVRGVQPLSAHRLTSLPAIGAKAAQLAELAALALEPSPCLGQDFTTPADAFAIPVVHSLEHYLASGARQKLTALEASAEFRSDALVRSQGLAAVRKLILEHPVEPALLSQVEAAVRARYGEERARFRSSSNTEDLPEFSGAGLHTSLSGALGDPERRIDDAMRTVWSSLFNTRAYEERALANIVESQAAMGILVHEAFLSEVANGVAVSRNLLDPTRGDVYYVNAQAGEASVTNPAPGVATDQLVYQWYRDPDVIYQGSSSLLGALATPPASVLSDTEVADLSCALLRVHNWFEQRLDPAQENRWFAMQVEFKLVRPGRQLVIKQARPHSFGTSPVPRDCREL